MVLKEFFQKRFTLENSIKLDIFRFFKRVCKKNSCYEQQRDKFQNRTEKLQVNFKTNIQRKVSNTEIL